MLEVSMQEEITLPSEELKNEKINKIEQKEKGNTAKESESWEKFNKGRDLVNQEQFDEAADLFSQVLAELVPSLGQFAKELGPVYTAYGRTLLQLGIENKDGILNSGAMPEKLVEDIASTNFEDGNENKKRRVVELDNVILEDDEDADHIDDGASNEEDEVEGADEGEEEEDEVEGEDMDDFELAWDVLDIARLIYADSANIDEKANLLLSEAYSDLGDVSMETESFACAAEDFNKAIEIKKTIGLGQERALAALYFKHAIALEYDNRLPEALEPLKLAKSLLKERLETLLKVGHDDKGKGKVIENSEVNELEQLLPEIDSKLEDVLSQLENGESSLMDPAKIRSTMNAAAAVAIQDLTGLVKKRKSEAN